MDTLDSEHFYLKWNNFETNLTSGFADLLQQEDMVDVTLAVDGKLVQAHKIILSICSSYFRRMFQINPCKHPIIILKDVGYQELVDMLDFMYRGETRVKQEDLPSFLKLAETLKVRGLAGTPAEAEKVTKKKSPTVHSNKEIVLEERENNSSSVDNAQISEISVGKKRKKSSSKLLEYKSALHKEKVPRLEGEERNSLLVSSDVIFKQEAVSDASLDSDDPWNPRRTHKPLSAIWSYFNFDCLENKSECKLCGRVFKASPKTGTASVKYHLHFAHQILKNNDGGGNQFGFTS